MSSRRTRSRSRAPPRPTTRCRRSATAWNSCAPSSTCGRGPTSSPPSSACAACAAAAIHEFFQERGFVYVHTPLHHRLATARARARCSGVTTLDVANPPRTEDGAVDWSQDFFGKHMSLTVSGQLNAENFAMAFGDVYTFGPTFRAENSNTPRHAAEFWMIEPEMAFADLSDYMDNAEAMIKYVINRVLERCPQEMEFFNSLRGQGPAGAAEPRRRPPTLAASPTPRPWRYSKRTTTSSTTRWTGAATCRPSTSATSPSRCSRSPSLSPNYPKEIKAFYMRLNDDGKTVAAADCLVPGIGEIVGGSQREERLDVLEARMAELGLDPADYWWYLDLRRYGSLPPRGLRPGLRAAHHVPHRRVEHPRRAAPPQDLGQRRILMVEKAEPSQPEGFALRSAPRFAAKLCEAYSAPFWGRFSFWRAGFWLQARGAGDILRADGGMYVELRRGA